MKSQHTKAHTFTSGSSQYSDQSLQKSVLYSNPRRNSIIFSPTLQSFVFFETAQPMWDKQSNRLLSAYTGQRNIKRTKEARTGNI